MSFISDAETIINALDKYQRESRSGKKPVVQLSPLEEIIEDLGLTSYIKTGGLTGDRLSEFIEKYLHTTTRLHHPSYMSHQVAVTHYSGALGSLIDGFTNNPMAIYEMGPGATSIEYFIINWLLEKVGWKPCFLKGDIDTTNEKLGSGVLMHGGSLANLTAILAARNKAAPDAWKNGNPKDLALLAPADCHYSIARAAGILGIGQNAIYPLQVDKRGAVIPDKLNDMYKRMTSDNKRAVALVANACSTAVGIYDPLSEIGDFCEEKNLWFHVDGAHGAGALLSKKYRHLLRGVEKADSLSWDAHKMLRTPALCAALLVRDYKTIDNAFKQEASYLFHDKEQPGFDFVHRTVECTKAGLGLKLFMVIAALGEHGLSRYIERQTELALNTYRYIKELPEFSCAVEPQSNILCFRVDGDDTLQIKLRDKLLAEGSFHVSTTIFKGLRYLRLTIMNPDTTMGTIKKLVQRIRELVN
jgi:L-2,4-diaminobutyrate decarboxylase